MQDGSRLTSGCCFGGQIINRGNTDIEASIKFIVIGFGRRCEFIVLTEVLYVVCCLWLKQTDFGCWICLCLQVDQEKGDLLCLASWKKLA